MNLIQRQFERILALVLIAALAACDAGTQQVESTEPAETTETTAPAEVTDRFANMFVDEFTDSFSPGLQVGEQFPAIRALHQGEEIASIDRFIRDRGAIFIATRSVDW